jgi:4-alpha-glucanotransferase
MITPFESKAFSEVIFRRPAPRKAARGKLILRVEVPQVESGESVALLGSGPMGDWKTVHLLSDAKFPVWEIGLDLTESIEYKFVIADTRTKAVQCWEEGPNRILEPQEGVIAEREPVFNRKPWRGAGVAVPVFSLRSEDSFGVGEFNDIKKLSDWAAATGQCIIQLLPVNDTTASHTCYDSYPYSAVSSFALHPQYIHLPAAGVPEDAAYKKAKARLEALPALDYEEVNCLKLELLRKLYDSPAGRKQMQSPAYKSFVQDNRDWLLPYAEYCVQRDRNDAPADFYCFLQYLADKQLKEAAAYAHGKGVALKGDLPIGVSRVSADAWQHPELFHLDSQAGAPPDFFSEDGQNWGFPTYNWEEMAKDGYAWWRARLGKMAQYFDAYRIDHVLGFFRIWEIPCPQRSGLLGHFSPALPYSAGELRAWGFRPVQGQGADTLFIEDPRRKGYWHPAISGQKSARYKRLSAEKKRRYDELHEDFFWKRHEAFWREGALEKLPALLNASPMLACAEDLGMVPACVGPVLDQLHILTLEIQRMPKAFGREFGEPAEYPYWSVCSTGSHDTSTLRAWWEEDPERTQRYYNGMLGLEGPAPATLEPWLAEMILTQQLSSASVFAILPLQDWLSVDEKIRYQGDPKDERINRPDIPNHYWRYRMHCTLESLLNNKKFNARLKALIEAAGRAR